MPSSNPPNLKSSQDLMFQRQLGDSELSYFLPSRKDGVNDMYLHLGFKAPPSIVNPRRLALAWAILRIRHPLLASRVLATPGNYEKVFFQYHPPSSPSEAETDASSSLEIRQEKAEVLIDSFLNGPRTLSNNRLSCLILSPNGLPTSVMDKINGTETESLQDFDLLICATHFLGDGMALHMLANDLFTLLAPSEKPISDFELHQLLIEEWKTYWGEPSADVSIVERGDVLPPTLESRLPKPGSGFQRIAQRLEFYASEDRALGSQVFPRQGTTTNPKPKRHTIVRTTSFDRCDTIKILAHCKKENVSISHLLFAVCNAAWIKVGKPDERLPMMMYSALNLRPYLPPSISDDCSTKIRSPSDSYWFLAVGYFNIVLPSFLARSVFHRARLVKRQCMAASKSQLLLSRTRCMANERSVKARKFAMIDDDEPDTKMITKVDIRLTKSASESVALLGLSLLGNLDGIYQHDGYQPSVILNTLTTGSRQRSGGLLVFGYTFAGKLWLSIGYDKESYGHQVGVWWDEVVKEMSVVTFIAIILLHLAALFSSKITLPTRTEISWPIVKKLIPVISVNVLSLVFNMLCLRDVDASFFQIARGLVLPLTILISSYSTRSSPSIPILLCASIVTLGFLIGILPSSLLSLSFDTNLWPSVSSSPQPKTPLSQAISLFYDVLSSLFIALNTVLIKTSLPHVEGSIIKLAWWTSLGSALALFLIILFSGEVPFMIGLIRYGIDMHGNVGGFGIWKWRLFLLGSTVTGFFGFFASLAGLLSIKVTSPISHMFSTAAKGVLQALLGAWLFKDVLTVPRASSILIILAGTILYIWVKSGEKSTDNYRTKETEESKNTGEYDIIPVV